MSAIHCQKCGAPLDSSARTDVCVACLEKLASAAWLDVDEAVERDRLMTSKDGRRFGDYELLAEIARGGMGIVYRARQISLKRIIALKVIGPERTSFPKAAERFQLEAEAAAKLDHPNIVPIYEIGQHDGQHYYTMKLVQGRSLARELNGKPLPPDRAAKWIVPIARALHYAHQHGVLHRDIKPGNILIDAGDQPHLLDFGLAKLLEVESGLTLTDTVMGSPAYMAPEQASGHAKQLTVATDIYSLGAVLYEALTGRPPFHAATALETMRRVVEQDPTRPTAFQAAIDRDLETICLKCLEKEPARRFPSGAALADDLERWLRHEPIQARPATAWEKAVKWSRRKPAIAALTGAVAAVGMLGLAGVLWQWQRANATAVRERQERRIAQANLYAADMVLAGLALQENDLGQARALLARHGPPNESEIDLRGWEWRYINGQCQSDELFSMPGHHRRVAVSFLTTNLLVSAGWDGTVRIWDLTRRREARFLNHGSPLHSFQVSPDGRWFAANDENAKRMFVWDGETLNVICSTPSATDGGASPVFLPRRRTVFFAQSLRTLARLTFDPEEPRVQPWFESSWIGSLACSPDGKRLAIEAGSKILIQNLEDDTARAVQVPEGPALGRTQVRCFSPDNRYLSLSQRQTVHLADTRTGDWLRSHHHHQANVSGVAFSSDGRFLISIGDDQAIWFQDVETWTAVARYRGHMDEIHSVAASPDGRLLATGDKNGTIKIWDAGPAVREDPLQAVLDQFGRVHFTSKADRFVTIQSTNNASELIVWDTATVSAIDRLIVEGESVLDAALLSGGMRIALARKDESVELWDLAARRRVSLLLPRSNKPPSGWGLKIAIPWLWEVDRGRQLVCMQGVHGIVALTAAEEREPLSLHVVEIATMKTARSIRIPFGFGVSGGNCSPDGKVFVVGGHDGEMVVISLLDGRTVLSTNAHGYALMKVEFLPERQLMATAGLDGYLQLWDTETWTLKWRLRADPHQIYSVAFHPDGTRVATGSSGDAPLTLWDTNRGRELARLPSSQKGLFNRLMFVDHDTLVGWAGDKGPGLTDEVVIWRAPSADRIEAAPTTP